MQQLLLLNSMIYEHNTMWRGGWEERGSRRIGSFQQWGFLSLGSGSLKRFGLKVEAEENQK